MVSVDISNLLVVVLALVGASESTFFRKGNSGKRHRRPNYYYKKCVPYVEYVTTYETEYVQQPVYKTAYETEYIYSTLYDTVYKTVNSIIYSTYYVPQYVTQTEYNTQLNYHTIYKTTTEVNYQSVYVTETKKLPTYVTTTDLQYQYQTQTEYQTVYSTTYQPQYITQTEYETQYETQYNTQYTPQYVTVTNTAAHTQTYCPPEPQQGYAVLDVQPGYEEPQVAYGGRLNNINSYSPTASILGTPGILEFHESAGAGGGQYLKKREAELEEALSPITDRKGEVADIFTEDKSESVDTTR